MYLFMLLGRLTARRLPRGLSAAELAVVKHLCPPVLWEGLRRRGTEDTVLVGQELTCGGPRGTSGPRASVRRAVSATQRMKVGTEQGTERDEQIEGNRGSDLVRKYVTRAEAGQRGVHTLRTRAQTALK